MIRYSFITAVLLIYSHSTNAAESFNFDEQMIATHLQEEGGDEGEPAIGSVSSSNQREDILCDRFNDDKKQAVCDKIVVKLIERSRGPIFHKFVDTSPGVPFSRTIQMGSWDTYKCDAKLVKDLNIKKRMFLCRSRLFDKKDGTYGGAMPGFLCAGSRQTDGRVFAFNFPIPVTGEVTPIVEVNNVTEILRYGLGRSGSTKNSAADPSSSCGSN